MLIAITAVRRMLRHNTIANGETLHKQDSWKQCLPRLPDKKTNTSQLEYLNQSPHYLWVNCLSHDFSLVNTQAISKTVNERPELYMAFKLGSPLVP